jgi:hypothetical protein
MPPRGQTAALSQLEEKENQPCALVCECESVCVYVCVYLYLSISLGGEKGVGGFCFKIKQEIARHAIFLSG